MFKPVQLGRIAAVCLISLSLGPVWARGGGGRGGGGAPASGGFRGGAGGGAAAGHSTSAAPAGRGAQHSNPGAAGAPPAPHPGGAAGSPHPGGASVGPHPGGASPHPGAAANVPHGNVGIHGNQPMHGSAVGANHVGGPLHGGPGPYHAEMMHSPGTHWNGYHQAYMGHHPVYLAHPGYRPSYYYHPWYHGPWGGHAWGWGWGFGPGVTFGFAGSGWGVGIGTSWGYPAYYGPYGPYGYWGRPLGWGFGGWGLGTTVYSSGYYVYVNPYYTPAIYPTVVYDYSRPIPVSVQAPLGSSSASLPGLPPPESPPILNNPAFDAARESFKRGDYQAALTHVDNAIRRSSSDAVMHEFRSLVLFALHDYRQSAAVAHSVLAVGPGWDYTTMSSLYPDPFVYSDQLRRLEDYTREHPRAADAHFLLAYHSMISSRKEVAIEELRQVIRLMPEDRLAGELLAMVQGPPKSTPAPQVAKSNPFAEPKRVYDGTSNPLPGGSIAYSRDPVESPRVAENQSPSPEPVDKELLPGEWSASREDGSRFRLVLTNEGTFIWKFSAPNNKTEELRGNYSVDGPVLILERKEGGALAGTAKFTGDSQMNFKLVGAPPEDKGLDFNKS
jgi:tetratricopeptide (TPR) repeat protein